MCPHAQIQREEIVANKEIRCLLVHDHVLLRQGLRRLLEDEPDMEVVAEAGNAAEALRKVFEHRPEVVITDAHVFECAADQAERLILHESACSKVLFLTTHEERRPAGGSASRSGSSCAVRQTSAEELVEMVRGTHAARKAMVREIPERRRGEWLLAGSTSAKAGFDGTRTRGVEVVWPRAGRCGRRPAFWDSASRRWMRTSSI